MKFVILGFLVFCSCAHLQESSLETPRDELGGERLNYLRKFEGKSEDDIVTAFGAPTRTSKVGSYTIFVYRRDLGDTETLRRNPITNQTTSVSRSVHYEEMQVFFKAKKVVRIEETEQ